MMWKSYLWVGLAGLAAWLPADRGSSEPSFQDVAHAIAIMRPTSSASAARGTVRFSPTEGGIEVEARIEGLPKGTRHGFHIHVYGDCSDVLAGSAGAHYDPTGNMLRMTQTGMLPLGDLEDLQTGPDGVASATFTARDLTIAGAENGILGRGILLHESFADPNDPMRSSGDAIACGTIGVFNKDRADKLEAAQSRAEKSEE